MAFSISNGTHAMPADDKTARYQSTPEIQAPPIGKPYIEPPEIETVTRRHIACDGGEGPLGHPRVWMEIGDAGFVDCGYCDKRFVLDGAGPPSKEALVRRDMGGHSTRPEGQATGAPDTKDSR